MDVLIHPAWPKKSWIKILLVVGCENDNSFSTAGRTKAIHKIQYTR